MFGFDVTPAAIITWRTPQKVVIIAYLRICFVKSVLALWTGFLFVFFCFVLFCAHLFCANCHRNNRGCRFWYWCTHIVWQFKMSTRNLKKKDWKSRLYGRWNVTGYRKWIFNELCNDYAYQCSCMRTVLRQPMYPRVFTSTISPTFIRFYHSKFISQGNIMPWEGLRYTLCQLSNPNQHQKVN